MKYPDVSLEILYRDRMPPSEKRVSHTYFTHDCYHDVIALFFRLKMLASFYYFLIVTLNMQYSFLKACSSLKLLNVLTSSVWIELIVFRWSSKDHIWKIERPCGHNLYTKLSRTLTITHSDHSHRLAELRNSVTDTYDRWFWGRKDEDCSVHHNFATYKWVVGSRP